MLLLIDNYDSFTYNLVQAFQVLGQEVIVLRNHCALDDIIKLSPQYIVIGPGPGSPCDAGVSKQILSCFAGKVPILGICLGHQVIGEFFGHQVVRAKVPMHGKIDAIFHHDQGLFLGLPQGFKVARYHSLVVEQGQSALKIAAQTNKNEIMALEQKELAIFGLQFHPESIATEYGTKLLENFLRTLS